MNSEYGEQKSLQEILEELVVYCASVSTGINRIQVILPQNILDSYSLSMAAKERIVLFGAPQTVGPNHVKSINFNSGIVTLHSYENNEEAIKGLV